MRQYPWKRAAALIVTAVFSLNLCAGCTPADPKPAETTTGSGETKTETAAERSEKDPETSAKHSEKDPETEAEESEKNPETEAEQSVKDPETEAEQSVKDPETEAEQIVKDPETEAEESEKESETEGSESGSEAESPSLPTMKQFLSTALQPVGTTLYVYGGGWNPEDTGAGEEARTLGLSEKWKEFFLEQDASYDYLGDTYPVDGQNVCHELGLDCSGFVGWTLYNTLEKENGREGYVEKSTDLAYSLYERGWGSFSEDPLRDDLLPGDIISMKGHVWICLGVCEDGSVLLVHSSPSGSREGAFGGGVSVSSIGERESTAAQLADRIMKGSAPLWYERYEPAVCSEAYLSCPEEGTGRFRFSLSSEETEASSNVVLSDPDGLTGCSGEEIVKHFYGF